MYQSADVDCASLSECGLCINQLMWIVHHSLNVDCALIVKCRLIIMNRPGVAGVVLQTPLYLSKSFILCENIFKTLSLFQTVRATEPNF